MAYTPPPRRSSAGHSRQGLLARARGGNALLSQFNAPIPFRDPSTLGHYLPPSGVRTNLIAGLPDPAAVKGATSYLSSISAPGNRLPTPTSPAVTTYTPPAGQKTSDVLKQLTTPIPFRDPSTLGIPTQGVQQTQGVQGVQGGPDVNALAAAAGQKLAGQQGAEGPESVVAPAQSFFSRMVGEKGSGKRSDIGRSMMQAGAAMMKGSPDGTFATIGQGLETGLAGYQDLKEKRREESVWDEQERRRKEIEAGIGASIGEVTDDDGNITRRALTEEEEARVRAVGGPEGIALAREIRQGTKKRDAINKYAIGADSARLNLLMSYDNDRALDEVVKYAESEEGRAAREAHLVNMGYSAEVAKDAAYDAASTQAVLNRGMETTIMRDGSGRLRVFHNGEYAGGFGDPTPVSATDAATLEAMQRDENWRNLAPLRESVTTDHATLKSEVTGLRDIASTIRLVNDEDLEDVFGPMGGVKLTVANWLNLDPEAKTAQVKNLLTKFGIQNLSQFKGAISEMELLTALENASSITQVKGLINAVMSRAMDNTIADAKSHNARARNLDSEFINPETGDKTGDFFSKPTAFGFDEEELEAYAMERDEIFDEWIDAATGGGTVNIEAFDIGDTPPLDPSDPMNPAAWAAAARGKGEFPEVVRGSN